MKFAVMLACRAGTIRMVGNAWEDVYHIVTMQVEDSREEAQRVADSQLAANPREVRGAWVEEIA